MFVAIDTNTDGMIHESDINWDGVGDELLKGFNKSNGIGCKVLNIDVEKDRVSLGMIIMQVLLMSSRKIW